MEYDPVTGEFVYKDEPSPAPASAAVAPARQAEQEEEDMLMAEVVDQSDETDDTEEDSDAEEEASEVAAAAAAAMAAKGRAFAEQQPAINVGEIASGLHELVLDDGGPEKGEACPICKGPFKAKKLLDCNHGFCGVCIFKWVDVGSQCPVCGLEVTNIDGYHVVERRPPGGITRYADGYKPKEVEKADAKVKQEACPICSDPCKAPKTLKCSHTFCGRCIFKWVDTASQCPVCDMEISDIDGYPVVHRKQRAAVPKEMQDYIPPELLKPEPPPRKASTPTPPIASVDCLICSDKCKAMKTLECKHQFCGSCIFKWVEKASQCPVCQKEITNIDGYPVVHRKQAPAISKELENYIPEEFLRPEMPARKPSTPTPELGSLPCPICTSLTKATKTLDCSHAFCGTCIFKWTEKSSQCPVCNVEITNIEGYPVQPRRRPAPVPVPVSGGAKVRCPGCTFVMKRPPMHVEKWKCPMCHGVIRSKGVLSKAVPAQKSSVSSAPQPRQAPAAAQPGAARVKGLPPGVQAQPPPAGVRLPPGTVLGTDWGVYEISSGRRLGQLKSKT